MLYLQNLADELFTVMGLIEVQLWSDGYDAAGIDRAMAAVVVVLDVVHEHGLRDARLLVKITGVGPQVGVVDNAPEITLEMADINVSICMGLWVIHDGRKSTI